MKNISLVVESLFEKVISQGHDLAPEDQEVPVEVVRVHVVIVGPESSLAAWIQPRAKVAVCVCHKRAVGVLMEQFVVFVMAPRLIEALAARTEHSERSARFILSRLFELPQHPDQTEAACLEGVIPSPPVIVATATDYLPAFGRV